MRRFLVLACVVCGVLVTTSVALADHGDAKPACADLINFDAGYGFDGIVTANLGTVEPSCAKFTYSVVIEVDPGEVLTYSVAGTGTTQTVVRSDPITTDADQSVCVHGETSKGKKDKPVDRIEDTGCITIAQGGSGGSPSHG
jgi:hypothetical protein